MVPVVSFGDFNCAGDDDDVNNGRGFLPDFSVACANNVISPDAVLTTGADNVASPDVLSTFLFFPLDLFVIAINW